MSRSVMPYVYSGVDKLEWLHWSMWWWDAKSRVGLPGIGWTHGPCLDYGKGYYGGRGRRIWIYEWPHHFSYRQSNRILRGIQSAQSVLSIHKPRHISTRPLPIWKTIRSALWNQWFSFDILEFSFSNGCKNVKIVLLYLKSRSNATIRFYYFGHEPLVIRQHGSFFTWGGRCPMYGSGNKRVVGFFRAHMQYDAMRTW